jgi:D-cysteine desulfhydrase family pyridoxal phosphate-dependent enzyme
MLRLPKIQLAALPTPVHDLKNLSREYFYRLSIKRDDLTGIGLGGNKVRKLEYLMSDAINFGAKMVITTGAVQSNHCRQTAASARRAGFDCTLVLVGEQPETISGNLFLDKLFGAKVVFCNKESQESTMDQVYNEAWESGFRPYRIPYGGSNPTGAAGYAYAMKELLDQIDPPDFILHASSSAGTQAGLLAGASSEGYNGTVIGISVDLKKDELSNNIHELAIEVCDLLEIENKVSKADIHVLDDYIGEGYGVMSERDLEAIRLFASMEGIVVDPVYTGRCAAGLIDLLRRKYFPENSSILFWHTGGLPAVFADRYQKLFLEQFHYI